MESTLITDIAKGRDTFRVATFHLQSFRFMPRDYQGFGKIKNQQDTGLSESRKILQKMRNTFYLHGKQSDYILTAIPESPYPLIMTGDLNDVPNSYAYLTLRGRRKDAFLEKGSGIGKTYTSPNSRFLGKLPTLRIDYIFTDPGFEVRGFHRINKPISDHYGLVADLKFPKKG
jgi:endonuclease/exonuclease/phosphatase (EEP) superfamily protein YafD